MSLAKKQSYIPNLCGVHALVTVVIASQLLAFILVLASSSDSHLGAWHSLGLVSLFVHWVSLSSLIVLCLLKNYLSKFTLVRVAVFAYLLVLLLTFGLSSLVAFSAQSVFFANTDFSILPFAFKNTLIAAIVCALAFRLIYLHHIQTQIRLAEASARVQALQARIRPHFLFNSMNTIIALIKKSPDQAELAVENLAQLFRSSILDENKLVTLKDELDSARKYLQIEKMRLGSRLRTDWQVESFNHQAQLPPLILQPLLENAVYYGIEPCSQGGLIRLSCKQIDGFIELLIDNPKNISCDKTQNGLGLALKNIKERLLFFFGDKGRLYLLEQADVIRVILTFPVVDNN